MAKKKEFKEVVKEVSGKISSVEMAKSHVKKAGVKSGGFDECYVCEDGNIFTHEGNCTAHSRRTKQKYFKVKM